MSKTRISFPNCLINRSTWFALSTLSILSLAFLVEPTKQSLSQSIPSKAIPLFIDNTKTFTTTNPVHSSIRAIIVNHLKSGYERFDFTLVESILATDFVFSYVIDDANIQFDDRRAYIAGRKRWAKWQAARRSLLYSIQDIDSDEAGRYVSVVAYSTYKTKYFSPRYLENLLFEKIKGKWMLKRQVLVPLHPAKPELYDVQIFVSDSDWAQKRRFRRQMRRKGPDWFIDRFRKDGVDSISSDESWHTILFVFREPPPPGSKIRTEIEFDTATRPRRYSYRIGKSQPYVVIVNKVRSGRDLPGTVTFRIFVDDTKIREKTIPR